MPVPIERRVCVPQGRDDALLRADVVDITGEGCGLSS